MISVAQVQHNLEGHWAAVALHHKAVVRRVAVHKAVVHKVEAVVVGRKQAAAHRQEAVHRVVALVARTEVVAHIELEALHPAVVVAAHMVD